jgi:hypothetical protein
VEASTSARVSHARARTSPCCQRPPGRRARADSSRLATGQRPPLADALPAEIGVFVSGIPTRRHSRPSTGQAVAGRDRHLRLLAEAAPTSTGIRLPGASRHTSASTATTKRHRSSSASILGDRRSGCDSPNGSPSPPGSPQNPRRRAAARARESSADHRLTPTALRRGSRGPSQRCAQPLVVAPVRVRMQREASVMRWASRRTRSRCRPDRGPSRGGRRSSTSRPPHAGCPEP